MGVQSTKGVTINAQQFHMSSPRPGTLPSHNNIRQKALNVFGKTPCKFQVNLCLWQLQKHNIISISLTGSGKTLTFWLPLLFSKNSVSIVVTALNILGDQFVNELEQAGFPAISVTAANNNEETFKVFLM